ncbi:MAG TPA: aminopeptidase N [Acetobacteraceae bacterium]|nr:aminopeptidase N [Acetobacteraceae bacterium]
MNDVAPPQPVRLVDYRLPDFLVDTVDLTFDLDEAETRVTARLAVRRNPLATRDAPLFFDGEALKLERVSLDGAVLGANRYSVDAHGLAISDVPDSFVLEVETRISPRNNTELSGLYVSNGGFFTQCEAQGFRRITFFPDRPDVMARYTTTIFADPARCPVLLSNGNPDGRGERDGRVWARWVDPHPKPSYLFALVAGDLVSVDDHFTTKSGRPVDLHIWVRRGDEDRCDHAMRSLKKAMAWDEEVFGLEYDLDVFNIAAVSDFNMGAMENKGLNVFNTKYVLARPDTATDSDYMGIESVVAHEYFHNWTGNRITCRDWFQLSLKEGLTVFRDQEFSADQASRAVKRIIDVRGLRATQFPEDAGPLAHPVRPESYVAIDNFYTATVYSKGAEVVRMIQTIIGRDAFRRGMDLYVARHDNQAVTIENFVQCMQEASGVDLGQFFLWYAQAGTPELSYTGAYRPESRRYELTFHQRVPPTPGQPVKRPVPIPVALALLDREGKELLAQTVLVRNEAQSFTFDDIGAAPVPSLLRGFSAPVKLHHPDDVSLRFLARHDTDPFVRWDSLQQYATQLLLALIPAWVASEALHLDQTLVEAIGAVLHESDADPSFAATAMALPSEGYLGDQMTVDDVDGVHAVRRFAAEQIGGALAPVLRETFERLSNAEDGTAIDARAIGRRSLKNLCLWYLARAEPDWAADAAFRQFERAGNMTDVLAALGVLTDLDVPQREAALGMFHAKWRDDPLVLDKWFAIQAGSTHPDVLRHVLALALDADFDLANPNRVRALVGTFAANRFGFHAAGGAGYRFLADTVLAIDPRNSQVAARMTTPLARWRRFDEARQALMLVALRRVRETPGLSRATLEMVSRSVA